MEYCYSVIALLMLLAGCASPSMQPFEKASQTPSWHETVMTMPDGVDLAVEFWPAKEADHTISNPNAIIIAAHGFNDYSNAFLSLSETLAPQKIALLAYDQRGFGRSGERGIWPGEENLVRDMRVVTSLVAARYPNTPIYLMGESMGGAVVILTTAQHQVAGVEGIILLAPAVWGGEDFAWWHQLPLWIGAHTVPDMEVTGENMVVPSDNIAMLHAMHLDPNVLKTTRIDSIYGVVTLMDHAYQFAHHVPIPTFILYGARDEVIPKEPVHEVMLALQHQRHAYYPQGYHLLTRDLNATIVHRDIAAWIADKTQPLPSGYDREVASRMSEPTPPRPSTPPWQD